LTKQHQISDRVYDYLAGLYGEESAKKYLDFIDEYPSVYVRVNPLKISRDELVARLKKRYNIEPEIFPSLPNTLKFHEREEDLGKTLEIAIGYYYIQGFSSMLPALALNPTEDDKVLDLCSAPGSKTTQMAEMMQNRGTLVVNEVQLDRIKALIYNLDRLNIINAGVIHSKGELLSKYYQNYFDKILVDAPCSGLGIIQKKIEVNVWWNQDRVSKLHDLQVRLLVSAIKMLRVGGELVYSTCTLTPEENELVINKLLRKYPIEIEKIDLPIEHRNGFTNYNGEELHHDLNKAIRILPWEVDSDGFFMIKLRKTAEIESIEDVKWKKSYTSEFLKPDDKKIEKYLTSTAEVFGIDENVFNEFKFILKRNDLFFINNDWDIHTPGIFHRIGTKFGTIDNKDNLVLHTHAAQIVKDRVTKNIYYVKDQEELRVYLAGGLILNPEIPQGQYVIKYNDYILGTAVVTSGGIKSRFPRSKRTQRIRLGEF